MKDQILDTLSKNSLTVQGSGQQVKRGNPDISQMIVIGSAENKL